MKISFIRNFRIDLVVHGYQIRPKGYSGTELPFSASLELQWANLINAVQKESFMVIGATLLHLSYFYSAFSMLHNIPF